MGSARGVVCDGYACDQRGLVDIQPCGSDGSANGCVLLRGSVAFIAVARARGTCGSDCGGRLPRAGCDGQGPGSPGTVCPGAGDGMAAFARLAPASTFTRVLGVRVA